MKSVILAALVFLVFQSSAQAADVGTGYTLITDKQVNVVGYVKPVSLFDTYPHKLTVETVHQLQGSMNLTSHTMQITQPTLDACIAAMKRIVASANNITVVGSTNLNTARRAYCTPAMQGAE